MFTDEQLDDYYSHLLIQLRLRIQGEFETLEAFSKASGIPRSTLSKVFSENITRDLTVGIYFRTLLGLNIISKHEVSERALNTKIRFREYIDIPNNVIMTTATIICNDL